MYSFTGSFILPGFICVGKQEIEEGDNTVWTNSPRCLLILQHFNPLHLFFLIFPLFFILLGSFLDRVRWDGMIGGEPRWLLLFSLLFLLLSPCSAYLFLISPPLLSSSPSFFFLPTATLFRVFLLFLCFSSYTFLYFLACLPREMRSISKR